MLAFAIKCYQCSSDEDNDDNCGAYERFDTYKNQPVECMGEEAVTPGKLASAVSFANISLSVSVHSSIFDNIYVKVFL